MASASVDALLQMFPNLDPSTVLSVWNGVPGDDLHERSLACIDLLMNMGCEAENSHSSPAMTEDQQMAHALQASLAEPPPRPSAVPVVHAPLPPQSHFSRPPPMPFSAARPPPPQPSPPQGPAARPPLPPPFVP
eukprot:EG_transcript_41396